MLLYFLYRALRNTGNNETPVASPRPFHNTQLTSHKGRDTTQSMYETNLRHNRNRIHAHRTLCCCDINYYLLNTLPPASGISRVASG